MPLNLCTSVDEVVECDLLNQKNKNPQNADKYDPLIKD